MRAYSCYRVPAVSQGTPAAWPASGCSARYRQARCPLAMGGTPRASVVMVTSDPMLAVVPIRCASGHYLRDHETWIPGAIIRGWDASCGCKGARSWGAPYGHSFVMCSICLESAEWRDPPCTAEG
jgi:hypothetical protein